VEYTRLGRSGLSASRLILGTMNFGPETSEEDSHTIMDRALEHGINFFDTANDLFPPPAPNGAKPAPEAYAW
jgi:aryl-alcohol dehydrogenase-like predicted oxidoreductase